MGNNRKIPLIEAIFEIRWGEVTKNTFSFENDQPDLLPGRLSAELSKFNYSHVEPANRHSPNLPHVVKHRFREAPSVWPCFQLGLGIFTVNQVEDGYSWKKFSGDIARGIEVFDKALPGGLIGLNESAYLLLRYQDAFISDQKPELNQYLSQHFNISAKLPREFTENSKIDNRPETINFLVGLDLIEPKGRIDVSVKNALIHNVPGMLMESTVVSKAKEQDASLSKNSIIEWLEAAHKIQKHAYDTLIKKELT